LTGRGEFCSHADKDKGLVIRNRIEYSFDEHLGGND
jgi:hypothetical protein